MRKKLENLDEEGIFDFKEIIKNYDLDIDNKIINRFKWLSLIRGILFLFVAGLYIKDPLGTNKTLVVMLGISIVFTGITKIINYFTTEKLVTSGRIISGIFDIIFGILILYNIEISFLTLTALVSLWIMIRGVTQIGIAFDLKRNSVKRWWLILISGILGIVAGMILFGNFELSFLYITIYNTINLIYTGILSIILFFDVKNLQKRLFE